MPNHRLILAGCLAALLPAAALAQEFDCVIEARQEVDVRAPVEGVIESVHSFAPSLIGTFFLVFLGAGAYLWTAMPGASIRPVLAAARKGKRIALANKELLVVAGKFLVEAARAEVVEAREMLTDLRRQLDAEIAESVSRVTALLAIYNSGVLCE